MQTSRSKVIRWSGNERTDGHDRSHYLSHTHPFNGRLSGTTRVSRDQKGKTNLDFTEARDSEWQWHQLGHMQVCTSLQTDNHASTPPLSFLQAGRPSCRPANSVKALKVYVPRVMISQSRTPKDQTSDLVEYSEYMSDSGAIQRTGSRLCQQYAPRTWRAKTRGHRLMTIILSILNRFKTFFSLEDSLVNLQLIGYQKSHRILHVLLHYLAKRLCQQNKPLTTNYKVVWLHI